MYVQISADEEGNIAEVKTLRSDRSCYENVCRRVIGKCSFLLLAVQPAILGENTP